MPYIQEISRATPGYLVILIDQSFSMGYPFAPGAGTKAKECATAVNRVLRETVLACTDGEEIKNSCDISVIGYGQMKEPVVNAFSGALATKPAVTIQELTEHCLRVETIKRKVSDGAGGLIEIDDQFPIWIESTAVGETPMAEAFEMAGTLVREWINGHPASFPPVVINITDGEANSLPKAGFVYKAKLETLIQLLEIGTKADFRG